MKPGAMALTVMLRGDFDGDGAREADESRLGGDVIRLPGVAGFGHDRGDVDDAAGALLEHCAEGLLDAQVRAGEVGAEHCVPVVELHAEGEGVAGDGGVVDENVEAAEFG